MRPSLGDRVLHVPPSCEGAAGRPAAAPGPAGGGELSGRGAAAAGQLRAAVSAELRDQAGGPHGGAARRGPGQSCAVGEPALGAAQVGRRQNEMLLLLAVRYP